MKLAYDPYWAPLKKTIGNFGGLVEKKLTEAMISLLEEKSAISKFSFKILISNFKNWWNRLEGNQSKTNIDQPELWRPNWYNFESGKGETT